MKGGIMENGGLTGLGQESLRTLQSHQKYLENAGLPKEVKGRKAAFVYANGGLNDCSISGLVVESHTVVKRRLGIKQEVFVELVTTPCILDGAPVLCFKIASGDNPVEVEKFDTNLFLKCTCVTGKGLTVGTLLIF